MLVLSLNGVFPVFPLQTEQARGGPADLRPVHRGPAGAHRLAVQGGAPDGRGPARPRGHRSGAQPDRQPQGRGRAADTHMPTHTLTRTRTPKYPCCSYRHTNMQTHTPMLFIHSDTHTLTHTHASTHTHTHTHKHTKAHTHTSWLNSSGNQSQNYIQ